MSAARQLAAENDRAQRDIAEARSRATVLEAEARSRGRATADQRFDAIVEDARSRAAEIDHALGDRAQQLTSIVEPLLDGVASAMLDVIIPEME